MDTKKKDLYYGLFPLHDDRKPILMKEDMTLLEAAEYLSLGVRTIVGDIENRPKKDIGR